MEYLASRQCVHRLILWNLKSQLAILYNCTTTRDLAARNVLVTGQGVAKVITLIFRCDYFSPRWPILAWRGILREGIITERCLTSSVLKIMPWILRFDQPYFSLLVVGGGGEAASALDESWKPLWRRELHQVWCLVLWCPCLGGAKIAHHVLTLANK